MLPGAAFSIIVTTDVQVYDFHLVAFNLVICLLSVGLIASANYTINEYLDREFDREHPIKKNRPSALGLVKPKFVVSQYFFLAFLGLFVAYSLSEQIFITGVVFLLMGIIYNVNPLRSKDRPYLDVLSEAINNPLRFLFGWFVVSPNVFPPSSILFAYWFGGAFLMAAKRFAEYRMINDHRQAARYRKSFAHYTEIRLLLSTVTYGNLSLIFLTIFLIKYRIEYILVSAMMAILFAWYLAISHTDNSPVQTPEKLYTEAPFLLAFALTVCLFVFLSFYDIEILHRLSDPIIYR